MNTWIKFLPSFSLVVFGFFVAKKICKEITLSGRHQKYSAFTISTLCKDCLPCNFPGRITVVNVSHGMFTMSNIATVPATLSGTSSCGLCVVVGNCLNIAGCRVV